MLPDKDIRLARVHLLALALQVQGADLRHSFLTTEFDFVYALRATGRVNTLVAEPTACRLAMGERVVLER